ncbi:transcriptional regulator [Halobacterium hubeiense]|uniref:transcriptional regulator n=1 Tax=Halobacterium hubeiense TaxID=1407499 RepID=UPI003C7127A4
MDSSTVRKAIQSCHIMGEAVHREIMHRQVDWMMAADLSILRVLDSNLALRTSDIAYNADLSRGYTSNRLSELVDHGLVTIEEAEGKHPRYRITSLGADALHGRVQPDELE